MTQKEVKKLSKDLVLAIDWAAAEYKYLKELKKELEEIKLEKDVRKKVKEITNAIRILRYVGDAERRAAKFEVKVEDELKKTIAGKLFLKLNEGLRKTLQQLNIEHDALVEYASMYEGLLKEELHKAAYESEAEAKFLMKYYIAEKLEFCDVRAAEAKKKAHQIQAYVLNLIEKIQLQVEDAEKWIGALEATLKRIQELKNLNDELYEGLSILYKDGWPFPEDDITTIFLAQHPTDLAKLAQAAGEYSWSLFEYGLPAVKDLINEQTWPGMVKIVQALGKNSLNFFRYGLPADKKSINEQTWPEIVQLVLENKDKLNQVLYSGQRPTFFKEFNGKWGIRRGKLIKTGSETIVLGGPLLGKAIIRIITDRAFQAWKKAFEAEDFWESVGFDYVPIEPILRKNGKLRAYKTREGLWRVSTKVLGPSLGTFLSKKENQADKIELIATRNRIIAGLGALKVGHGHLHDDNFCIDFYNGKKRVYAIDFDHAVS